MAQKKLVSKVRAKVRWGVAGVFVLLAFTIIFDAPGPVNQAINFLNARVALGLPMVPSVPFQLGLDLQGGTHLVYGADVSTISASGRSSAVEGVRDVIERRVNGLGIGEANVQTTKVGNDYRLIVELPGVSDVKQAIAMIGETPILEFKEPGTEASSTLAAGQKSQADEADARAKKKAEDLLKKIRLEKNFSEAAKRFSEDEKSKSNGGNLGYITENTIWTSLYQWAAKAKTGDISPVFATNDGYSIGKRGQERAGATEVKASHILICYLGAKSCATTIYTKAEAKKKAEEIFKQANTKNFADLAKQYSHDPGSKDRGGELGTFGHGAMVPAFEQAVFSAKIGQIIGPVESEFGYHVIYKTGESAAKEYEVSRILIKSKHGPDATPNNVWKSTGLSGKQLKHTEVVSDPSTGAVQVSLQFNDDGRDLFKAITTRNVGKPVGIFLDGQLISAPTVNQPILGGQAVITGQFSITDAQLLSQRLNAGALPIPVELISQEHIGPSLGADSLRRSLYAGAAAFLVIILFMVVFYRLPGLVSAIALALYIALSLSILKLFGIALSLAGIAGFIMSIGVAVDANVLIFERLKEELRAGRTLLVAVEEGFLRAWTSIRDSNISSLITCSLLMSFGSSFVKGFAVTLAIGILVSMFSAITVTRILLRFIVPWFSEHGNRLFLGAKQHSAPATIKNQQ